MKKLSIYLLGALAMAFSACDDGPETAPTQANPQLPVLEGSNVNGAAAGVLATPDETIALENYKTEPSVQVLSVTEVTDLPAGAKMSYEFELGKNEGFDPLETMPVTMSEDGNGYVDANSWSAAHVLLFGKSPKVKDAFYRIAAYATVNGIKYRVGGPDYYVAQGAVKETCMDQGFVIYDTYYFISNLCEWSLSPEAIAPYQFNHSATDVYEDPVFTITFETTGDIWWKIASQEAIDMANNDNDWSKFIGTKTDSDEALEGTLTDVDAQSGKIVGEGTWRLTVNMETMEYTIEELKAPEYLSTPGNSNGWNKAASNWLGLVKKTENDVEVSYNMGAAVLDGIFKLYAGDTEAWDNAKTYGAKKEGDAFVPGALEKPGSDIPVDAAGLYWVKVNTAELTYVLTPITTVGIVGGTYGWDAGLAMTPSEDFRIWTADVTFDANTNWKFKFNGDPTWEMNYGADTGNQLKVDGGDIWATEAGEYTITISFAGNYPTYTMTKK